MTTENLARQLYEAYGRQAEWKTFNGGQMPPWFDLGERVQNCWAAAAVAATSILAPAMVGIIPTIDYNFDPSTVGVVGDVKAELIKKK